MPLRGLKVKEWAELNKFLEVVYKAEKDHRFVRLHGEKPLTDDWTRIYEYDPAVEFGLPWKQKQIIANCGIYPQFMQYGQAVILNGGIRDVGTHPKVRGKRYGLQTVADAVRFMKDNGVDISILFAGPQPFYEKNGWINSIPHTDFKFIGEDFKKWWESPSSKSELAVTNLTIHPVVNEDIPILTELYKRTNIGLYFAAYRDEFYFANHFKVDHNRQLQFVVAYYEGKIIGYIHYGLSKNGYRKVIVTINEARFEPSISSPAASELDLIFRAFLKFIMEEAINESDMIGGIAFHLSINNPLITHFFHFGFRLKEEWIAGLGMMIQLINLTSLFTKLIPEIQSRASDGLLPRGQFWLQFDRTEKHPGGVLISIREDHCEVHISEQISVIKQWQSDSDNIGVIFKSITPLTLLFCGAIIPSELENDDIIIVVNNDANPRRLVNPWLEGLFSNITNDMYVMDKF